MSESTKILDRERTLLETKQLLEETRNLVKDFMKVLQFNSKDEKSITKQDKISS